jgi:periplasmic divalent cation tolerance protein
MPDFIHVVTTIDSAEAAAAIAQALVEQRLAACVQVAGPITSTYWWQGEIQTAQEWYCVAKTRADHFPQIEQAIRALHPYDVPEILATPILAGHAPYLDWLASELRSPQ